MILMKKPDTANPLAPIRLATSTPRSIVKAVLLGAPFGATVAALAEAFVPTMARRSLV